MAKDNRRRARATRHPINGTPRAVRNARLNTACCQEPTAREKPVSSTNQVPTDSASTGHAQGSAVRNGPAAKPAIRTIHPTRTEPRTP
jgi:hypothetical protein